jgi:hypothetical protein
MRTPWTARVWAEYRSGNLTRAFRDVLLTLHTFRGSGGQCWPSHATLADRARCCVRTVQRALAQAQHLGLVDWAERRVRAGWRWLRTSNLYRFMMPPMPVTAALCGRGAPATPLPDPGSGGGGKVSQKGALSEVLRAAAGLPDLLLARRLAMVARFAAVRVRC